MDENSRNFPIDDTVKLYVNKQRDVIHKLTQDQIKFINYQFDLFHKQIDTLKQIEDENVQKMKNFFISKLNEFEESGTEPTIDHQHAHFSQPEDVVAEEELKKTLIESLDLLTEKERKVNELYYYEEMTLKEISKILEVSESRVSQLHTKSLIKMKKIMGPYIDILVD